MRSLITASAHGCSGTLPGGRSAARLSRCFTGLVGSQKPERSILPSGVRGGGLLRSTLPSFALGTFFIGCSGHCAAVVALMAQTARRPANRWMRDRVIVVMVPATGAECAQKIQAGF